MIRVPGSSFHLDCDIQQGKIGCRWKVWSGFIHHLYKGLLRYDHHYRQPGTLNKVLCIQELMKDISVCDCDAVKRYIDKNELFNVSG